MSADRFVPTENISSLPSGRTPSREEIANREVGHTSVRPSTARMLVAVFLTLIAIPAGFEAISALRGGEVASSWSRAAGLPSAALETWRSSTLFAANGVVLDTIRNFEDALDEESRAPVAVRPFVQAALSTWLDAGSERVIQGRDGWLFYRPDVEHVVGRGFLDRAELRRRALDGSGAEPLSPDPRIALLDFNRQLSERGIALVVVPTPVKPSVEPQQLGAVRRDGNQGANQFKTAASSEALLNSSYAAFLGDMRRAGVDVFDLAGALAYRPIALADVPQYLATDTHWRPETMERAAALIADHIRSRVDLPPVAPARMRVTDERVVNVGDTAAMLDLPRGHPLARPEVSIVRRVVDERGAPWRPSRDADVLVLGDSFSNIYSLESMGWGNSAGFVEHLSLALARPIDRIVQNDAGVYATRDRLRREIAAGTDRLAGKRVVVLQFSARELSIGDWKVIELP